MRIMLQAFLLLLLCSCGGSAGQHQVRISMADPGPGAEVETGRLQLVFSQEATHVVVAINGRLVLEKENAKRIMIHGVETGYANLSIAADGVERSAKVWIDAGKVTAVPVGNPGSPERMNPVVTTALSIVAFLISRAATDYLF
jgi:hypothetical protein